jgi:hypothetical protein
MHSTTRPPAAGGTSRPADLLTGALFLTLLFSLLPGCGSTAETQGSGKATDEEIRNFESTFDPSDYDPMRSRSTERIPRKVDTTSVSAPDEAEAVASQEMIQGFRVQVFSSTSIDAVRAKREEFESLFPEEWFYVEHHAPSYKLRAGNFLNRFEADRFARTLADQGYTEAWAVPEKVFKSPGRRSQFLPPADQPRE